MVFQSSPAEDDKGEVPAGANSGSGVSMQLAGSVVSADQVRRIKGRSSAGGGNRKGPGAAAVNLDRFD